MSRILASFAAALVLAGAAISFAPTSAEAHGYRYGHRHYGSSYVYGYRPVYRYCGYYGC